MNRRRGRDCKVFGQRISSRVQLSGNIKDETEQHEHSSHGGGDTLQVTASVVEQEVLSVSTC